MAGRRSRSTKFKLKLAVLREALAESQEEAERAIAAGPKAIKAAQASGDKEAAARHRETLKNARASKKNLAASVRLIKEVCCDQFLNCDPDYS